MVLSPCAALAAIRPDGGASQEVPVTAPATTHPAPASWPGRATSDSVAPTVWIGVAAVAALALALRLPVATTVLGLVLFGLLHNVLELRYVAGRFDNIL